jgi:hypothetical protein
MQVVVKGLSMEKWFCWAGLGVAGLMLLLFVLDAIMEIPFGGLSMTVDIIAAIACALLAYLSWNAYRDIR